MKYRKKPVVIDAIQWDGSLSGWRKIESEFPQMRTTTIHYHEERNEASGIRIATLEGSYDVSDRDYIIRGVKGEFYPCKPDIFEMTYEKAEEVVPHVKTILENVEWKMKTAVFSGRFDPPHVGHVLTVKRILKRYDRVIVVVLDYDTRKGCTTNKAKEILCELLIGVSGPGIITIITNKHHFGQITQSQYLRLLDECFADPRDTVYVSGNAEVIEHWKATMRGLMFEFVERSGEYSGTEIRRQQREGRDVSIPD